MSKKTLIFDVTTKIRCTWNNHMEDIRPNLGSNLKKIRGSKVSLESPGYADYHTRSLTMRLLGEKFCGAWKWGGSYWKSSQKRLVRTDVYLTKVTCPFFVKIDFLIGYDKLGYGEQNLPGWQFFKCPEVRFFRTSKWRHKWRHYSASGKKSKIFSFKYTCIIYRWKGNFPVIKSLFETCFRKWSGEKLQASEDR